VSIASALKSLVRRRSSNRTGPARPNLLTEVSAGGKFFEHRILEEQASLHKPVGLILDRIFLGLFPGTGALALMGA
jgi:hypothetical protein